MLAIFSGAWQGELLRLKWSDVDWINNQIHIQKLIMMRHGMMLKRKHQTVK